MEFALLLVAAAFPAFAQVEESRQELRESVGRRSFSNLIAAFTLMNMTIAIPAAAYRIRGEGDQESLTLSTIKVPYNGEFELKGLPCTLFVEGNIGYLHARQDVHFDLGAPSPSVVHTRWQAFSAMVGTGLTFPVGEGFGIRPTGLIGYTRVESDATYDELASQVLKPLLDGIVYGWEGDALISAGALALFYYHPFPGGLVDLNLEARYMVANVDVIQGTEAVQEQSEGTQLLIGRFDVHGPLGLEVFHLPLGWRIFGGPTWLMGHDRQALGFDRFVEIGGTLETRVDRLNVLLSNLSLSVSGFFGPGIRGYSVGVGIHF